MDDWGCTPMTVSLAFDETTGRKPLRRMPKSTRDDPPRLSLWETKLSKIAIYSGFTHKKW